MKNQEKTVLITGGTSGIGLELAKCFAQDNYNLVIVARNQQELDSTSTLLTEKYGIKVHVLAIDLFNKDAAFEVFKQTTELGISIDVLVNDAGQGLYGKFVETDVQKEMDIIQLNITSLVCLTKYYLKEMVARNHGRILNLGSIAGKIPGPYQSVYHGTKAFVLSFTEAIRNELQDTDISITALLPGATDTDFFQKAHMEDAKIVQEGDLDDPAKVARDGYEALMNGEGRIISGIKNKAQVAMSNIMPDSVTAENIRKQQEPVKKK